MDTCFDALTAETRGRLAAGATKPTQPASSSLRIATGLAYALGDFVWPATWFLMTSARRAGRDVELVDVAA